MDVLAFPFRFETNGRAATVTQFSDSDLAQKISFLMQTEPGNLPLAPQFGIFDPSFRDMKPTEIEAAVLSFYPEIAINDIRIGLDDSGETAIEIFFLNYSEA